MRNQNLQTIREACIKANPGILELKFGCALQRPDSGRPYIVIEDMTWGANTKEVWINSVPFGSMSLPLRVSKEDTLNGIPDDNGEVWQVIGRTIRLADVLLAIGSDQRIEFSYSDMNDGEFRFAVGYNAAYWNLRKDDLTEQSDECLSFLVELLK